MVTKPPSGSSRLKSSLANTSVSSCDSVSSTASSASAAPRLTTSRPAATSTPAADRGGAKLARTKSLNPITKPAPITRRARPSVGAAHPPNLNAEIKPAGKSVTQATMKRRLSVTASSKSALGEKMPSSSSATAASKPPPGQSRKVLKAAAPAADARLIRKK